MKVTAKRDWGLGRRARRVALVVCVGLSVALGAPARPHADPVTEWTEFADYLGAGWTNWRSMALMHMAMHDALNAAEPVYQRFAPARADEPGPAGADPQVAMAAAAAQVLRVRHPERAADIERFVAAVVDKLPAGQPREAGLRLGTAIGNATLERRANDGYSQNIHPFKPSTEPGFWRPEAPGFRGSDTTTTLPYLFANVSDVVIPPPPTLGGPIYLHDTEEVRRLGSLHSKERTDAQTDIAVFWALQSSQRGFTRLAMDLLKAHPRPGGLHEHARIMAQLGLGLADGAIIAWAYKEKFAYWRPISAIRHGGFGVQPDPSWSPAIATPPFPEYPSGHATDCTFGSLFLSAIFGDTPDKEIVYHALPASPPSKPALISMGNYDQDAMPMDETRTFPNITSAGEECFMSRIWAGVHFRAGEEGGRVIGTLVAKRALDSVPKLPGK